jgi:hypothetical protein
MTQNTSSAVMQQRTEARDSLDDFPTPPWATRALCEWIVDQRGTLKLDTCREPAANRGHMVRPLLEYFKSVDAFDIHDYGAGFQAMDYLASQGDTVDWTITNPPFRLAEQFIERAKRDSHNIAMLVRTAFLESVGRYERLFQYEPPSWVLQFTERVVMHKGVLTQTGSTATAYCWVIWDNFGDGTRFGWIPPCRKRLERDSDYCQGLDYV